MSENHRCYAIIHPKEHNGLSYQEIANYANVPSNSWYAYLDEAIKDFMATQEIDPLGFAIALPDMEIIEIEFHHRLCDDGINEKYIGSDFIRAYSLVD